MPALLIVLVLAATSPVWPIDDAAVAEMRALYEACAESGSSVEARARLDAWWTAHDASHACDWPYQLEKSLVLDWLDEPAESERVFRGVPDEALEQAYQIGNRLRVRIDDDLELALPLMLRLADVAPPAFESWVHESYAQRFAPRPRADVDLAAHRALLERVADAGGPARQIVSSLLAWVDVLASDDTPRALRAALARPAADGARSERYRLLLVDEAASHPELHDVARRASLDLVDDLERRCDASVAVDAARRARERYVLAQACLVHARRFCADDPDEEVRWLLRAARGAPGLAEQGVTAAALSYEQVCLGGAFDPRAECAARLEDLGRPRDALQAWLELVLATPARIEQARAAFVRLAPERDVEQALLDLLDARLPSAPDFELPTPDGTTLRLSDLRGRWVLLDFWGTWCGPCRAELPAIEALHRACSQRADGRAAVLTVACRDTAATVDRVRRERGDTFPVVLGDDDVTSAFGVTGFPTKILVTPRGHSLVLAYGRGDWESAARAFLFGPP